MAIRLNTFEGCTAGTAITSSNQNSDGSSGDVLTIGKGGGGTILVTTNPSEIIQGTKSAKSTATTAGDLAYGYWDDPGMSACGLRVPLRLPAAPVGGDFEVAAIRRAGSATGVTVVLKTTGKLELWDAGGFVYATPSALTLPAVVWVDVAVEAGTTTSNGKASFAVYDANGALTAGMSAAYTSTARNTGTTNYVRALAGLVGNPAGTGTVIWDSPRWTDTYALQGPPGSSDVRPIATVSAGLWTPQGGAASLHGALADNDDATYMASSDNPSSDTARVRVAALSSESGVSVSYRYRVSAASPARSLVVKLYMSGSVLIATRTITGITSTSWVADSLVLSPSEVAALTDRDDLEVELTAS